MPSRIETIKPSAEVQHRILLDLSIPLMRKTSRINMSDTPMSENLIDSVESIKREKPPSIIQSIKLRGLFSKIFIISSYTVASLVVSE